MTGLHKETIQARLRDGSLQAKKLGGTWRIYRSNFAPSEKVDVDLNIERE